jgi:hypothetical protein
MKRHASLAIALLFVGAAMTPTRAEDPKPNTANGNMVDLLVPESPAFTALGLTPQSVTRPASPRELATTLLDGLDDSGNFQAGIALDTSPYLLLKGDELDIKEYQSNRLKRLLARFQVSFATAKGTEDDDKSMKLALGFRATPFDLGDPRLDQELSQCFTDRVLFPSAPVLPSLDANTVSVIKVASAESAAKECRAASKKRNWNRSAWDLGVAPTWTSEDGTLGNLKGSGAGVWTSAAYGFEEIPFLHIPEIPFLKRTSQFMVHARYRTKEFVPDPMDEGNLIEQDSALVGGRLRVGAEWAAVNLEGAWTYADPRDGEASDSYRVAGGGEIRLVTNLWLVVTVGEKGSQGDRDSEGFVLSSLKWGLSGERTLGQ